VVSLLEVSDAKAITIPHICLASPDEPADTLEQYVNELKEQSEFDIYRTMFHEWMGARANLQDKQNADKFDRGYVCSLFSEYKINLLKDTNRLHLSSDSGCRGRSCPPTGSGR
jgi:hypothetical protein